MNKNVSLPKTNQENEFELTSEEKAVLESLDTIKEYEKGSVLISEGQYFHSSYYVMSGMVRQFKLINGEDVTSNFYTERQSVFSSNSAFEKTKATFTLICQEDSLINVLSFELEKELCEQFPRFNKICRLTTERMLSEHNESFALFKSSTPEQRYIQLVNDRPELIDRVPQYHLSSYLGIKPESLSRIRNRIAKKNRF